MRSLVSTLRSAPAALTRSRADRRARAVCPVDSWAFAPAYTDGRCPLCGWAPQGYVYSPPLLTPYDRYWAAMAGIAAISVIMLIAVVIAFSRG
ncbi:MAG TPA: hypothetical protein VGQ42_05335 [Candidatus Dormibacteraeota bacterium]|jgi:hypothetical protein|nr:hypothetical protein [Candidatus Dormibacteraeota bacterium]